MPSLQIVPASWTACSNWAPLLERVQQGDNRALEEFYREWFPRLYYYFGNRVGWDSASDYAQEVFLDALARIQQGAIADLSCFPGYIFTVAARRVCRHIRHHGREKSLERIPPSSVRSADRGPDAQVYDQQQVEILQRALARLSPRQREILTRFYLYEQSPEQIQREMGLSKTQYRLLKSRAKTQLGLFGQRESKPKLLVMARSARVGH